MSPTAAENATAHTKILVWDAPVRVFHWLLALSGPGAASQDAKYGSQHQDDD